MIDKQAAWDLTGPFEGFERVMYRDNAPASNGGDGGFVTCGCGNLVTHQTVVTLPWQHADGTPANTAEIIAEYERVAALPKGMVPGFYRRSAKLWLPGAFIRVLFYRRIDEFQATLARNIPGFDNMPAAAQLGLFDMVFNLGIGELRLFHTFFSCALAFDYKGMAANCHRKNTDPSVEKWDPSDRHEQRQIKVRDLFLSCA